MDNMKRLAEGITDLAKRGAEQSYCRNCWQKTLLPYQTEEVENFDRRNFIRDNQQRSTVNWQNS